MINSSGAGRNDISSLRDRPLPFWSSMWNSGRLF